MAAGKIRLKTLSVSLLAILLIEGALQLVLSVYSTQTMVALGIARVLEAVALIGIVRQFSTGAGAVGLTRCGLVDGCRRGLIWSAGFGLIAAVILSILLGIGADPLAYLRVPMPAATVDVILLFCVAGVLSPVAEEIFFRGILYGYFRRWGISAAVILSTLLFVIAHGGGSQVPVTQMVGGMVFAVAYEIEDNLMVPITIHVLGNTAIYTVGYVLQFGG